MRNADQCQSTRPTNIQEHGAVGLLVNNVVLEDLVVQCSRFLICCRHVFGCVYQAVYARVQYGTGRGRSSGRSPRSSSSATLLFNRLRRRRLFTRNTTSDLPQIIFQRNMIGQVYPVFFTRLISERSIKCSTPTAQEGRKHSERG